MMKKITLYCDGACLGNPGFGGWCAILCYQDSRKIISGGEANTTNNRMELSAVLEGLKALKEPCVVDIVSDSNYVCDGINKWLKNWLKKDFKEVKNPDLWREYVKLSAKHDIKAHWVKGHSGHTENEECDKIAKDEAGKVKDLAQKNGEIGATNRKSLFDLRDSKGTKQKSLKNMGESSENNVTHFPPPLRRGNKGVGKKTTIKTDSALMDSTHPLAPSAREGESDSPLRDSLLVKSKQSAPIRHSNQSKESKVKSNISRKNSTKKSTKNSVDSSIDLGVNFDEFIANLARFYDNANLQTATKVSSKIAEALALQCPKDSHTALQKHINYKFKDENILLIALTHKSFDKHKNNERLEFLGDAVMDLIIGEYVFRRLPHCNEGDLTKIRAAMVNENGFANLANALELGKYIFISNSECRNDGRKKPSILSDAFEALIGAIYIDGGLDCAKKVALSVIESVYKGVELENLFVDYKTALQELTQAICGDLPEYNLIRSSGPDHNKKFTMQVLINAQEFAKATGKSKKEAEQECAKIAYNRIKQRKGSA